MKILTNTILFIILISPINSFSAEIINNYAYDDIGRIISIKYSNGTIVDYVYDSMGNRLQKTTTLPGSPPNNHPNPASKPSIPDGATNVSKTPILTWTGSDPDADDEVVYYVYFGTPENLELASSGWHTTYIPEPLFSLTTYCWQVVSRDSHNKDTQGPVWCFTTRNENETDHFTELFDNDNDLAYQT